MSVETAGWPRAEVVVRDDGSGRVTINGQNVPIYRDSLVEARSEVMRLVMEYSTSIGLAVEVRAQGPEGPSGLTVYPDGNVVQDDGAGAQAGARATAAPQAAPVAAPYEAPTPQHQPPGSPGLPAPAAAAMSIPVPAPMAQPFQDQAQPFQDQGQPFQDQLTQQEPPYQPDLRPEPLTAQRTPQQSVQQPVAAEPVAPQAQSPAQPQAPQQPAVAEPAVAEPVVAAPAAQPAPAQEPVYVPAQEPVTPPSPAVEAPAEPPRISALQPGAAQGAGSSFGGAVPPATDSYAESRFGLGTGPDGGRRDNRRSFLVQDRLDQPAKRGLRGALARLGLPVPPSEAERTERADARIVSQHWPGPRTISIVNGKGGAGKTPATVLLSAVFSSHGGSGVVSWDNNQTRGTLGWRTEQGPHESTLLDLIPQTEHFLGPEAQLADLAWFVHHQTRDRFDVLRSKPMALAHEQRISSEDVDAIHAVLSKYYRMILIDSGNDESDPMWLRMIDHTDQLVVATTTRDDHAEAGALLLEALANRGEHMAELARKAVVVVSQADPKATASDMRRVAQGYRSLAREVVTIPFDPAMVDGQLVYQALRPATRRAWLAAGAAVARDF